MRIPETAFNGLTVTGFRPQTAPNPSCCSDPAVLCPTCAALALPRAGVTGNELVVNQEAGGDILPLPCDNTFTSAPSRENTGHGARLPTDWDNDYQYGHSGVGLTPDELLQEIGLIDEEEQAALDLENRRRLGLADNEQDILPLPDTMAAVLDRSPCPGNCHNCEHQVTCNLASDDAGDVLVPPSAFA